MSDDLAPDHKCFACARSVPADVEICPHCGRPISDVPPVVTSPARPVQETKRVGRHLIILLSVCAALSLTAAFPPWLKVRWDMTMGYLGLTAKNAKLAVDFDGFDFILRHVAGRRKSLAIMCQPWEAGTRRISFTSTGSYC